MLILNHLVLVQLEAYRRLRRATENSINKHLRAKNDFEPPLTTEGYIRTVVNVDSKYGLYISEFE